MKKRILKQLCLTLIIAVFLLSFCLSATADHTGQYTLGQNVGGVQVFQSEGVIQSFDIYAGALPEGVDLTWNEYGIYMTGAPQSLGSFSASYTVLLSDGNAVFTIRMTVSDNGQGNASGQPNRQNLPAVIPEPNITKHPTGETVEAGESAQFVARAENATKIIWRLVSEDTNTTYNCSDASYYFPGLVVSGLDTDCLTLEGIPNSMNKWCVEAKFEGPGGVAYSNGARIIVKPKAATDGNNSGNLGNNTTPNTNTQTPTQTKPEIDPNLPPTKPANIYSQPVGSRLKEGESFTLSVMATSPNNGQLSYQWYSCPLNDRAAAIPIDGATEPSYTPPQTFGTMYYCVAVINSRDSMVSEPVYSDLVELSYEPVATPTPLPTPTPSVAPIQNTTDSYDRGSNAQLIFFGLIGFLALAALIGVIVYLRIEAKRDRD